MVADTIEAYYENSNSKVGNSLALRIPRSFADESNIEQGSLVDLSVIEGKRIIVPVSDPEYTLEELLAGVTEENIHAEY